MNNISSVGNFVNNGVKFQLFEHKPKGLVEPQISKYTKSEYDKNRISLYEYKEVKLLNPNSEKSNSPKYAGYELPSIGLVAPDKIKVASYGGVYEYPVSGQH